MNKNNRICVFFKLFLILIKTRTSMSQFRTIVSAPQLKAPIPYDSRLLFMGSCFAQNIGERFQAHRMQALVNPFGVIYNPVSVAQSLQLLLDNKRFDTQDLHFHNQLWHSFSHHGSFSSPSPEDCLETINTTLDTGRQFLAHTHFLFITFGTAWVYEHIDLQQVVSNCHKYPAAEFNRYRLEVDEIIELYKDLIIQLRVFNPQLKIIFTVSPVRHWKDGANGNQLSKATLLLAIDKLVEWFEDVSYFPAYELVLDDLRDYRFYEADMLHPNNQAVDYIWQQLLTSCLNDVGRNYLRQVEKIIKARQHRPFNPNTDNYQLFLQKTLEQLENLNNHYPNAPLEEDRQWLQEQITNHSKGCP
jgi:hypothetical protein